MDELPQLPGLEHLMSVLARHGESVDLRPPLQPAPQAGEDAGGVPLDPMLAAVYARLGGGKLGNLFLKPRAKLVSDNQNMWTILDEEPRVRKLFCYGKVGGFAYEFATVPHLAGRDGLQPVVYFVCYDDMPIWPIASNVDRAFRLYAKYCERRHKAGGTLEEDSAREEVRFPFGMVNEIAQDEALVESLRAGRFDEFFRRNPGYPEEDPGWIRTILGAVQAGR